MTYYYKLGYYDWEESPHIVLGHVNQFTESEFNEMVLQCYVLADEESRKNHENWFNEWLEEKIQADESIDEEYIEDMRYKPSISDLYNYAIEYMKNEFGFFELNISQSFIPSNSYNLLDDENSDDEQLMMIRNRLLVVEKRNKKINNILK